MINYMTRDCGFKLQNLAWWVDIIPVLSTGKSITEFFLILVRPILSFPFPSINKTYAYRAIQDKSWFRIVCLLVPGVNFLVVINDYRLKNKGETIYEKGVQEVIQSNKNIEGAVKEANKLIDTSPKKAKKLFAEIKKMKERASEEWIQHCQEAAACGSSNAYFQLGIIELRNWEKSKAEAREVEHFMKNSPDPSQHQFVSIVYGDYLYQAIEYFEKAADLNHIDALHTLAQIFRDGNSKIEADSTKAAYYFHKLAWLGNPLGMEKLADSYYNGEGVPQSDYLSYSLTKQAANLNHLPSINLLAGHYEKGIYVKEDPQMAFSLWKKAADLGDPWGICNVGTCYAEGYGYGGPADIQKALSFWITAAQRGCPEAFAQLADCFYNGTGVTENHKTAAAYWWEAVRRGHRPSMKTLADCYFHGDGVPKDPGGMTVELKKWAYYLKMNQAKREAYPELAPDMKYINGVANRTFGPGFFQQIINAFKS